MDQSNDIKKLVQRKRRLARHLFKMKSCLPDLLEHAFDRYYETQALTYIKVEEEVYRFEELFAGLGLEVETTDGMGTLRLVARRVNYIADQLDALESNVFKRARRRRRNVFNLAEFFEKFSNANGNGTSQAKQEISSLTEAYEILDLEEGCSLSQIMTSFRKLAKKYHPDSHGGDRSREAELRRVVEAYQVIKENFA